MSTTINDTIALLKHFISASQNADINSIAGLLSDEGLFEIEDDNFDLVDTSKNEYLQWYKNKLQETKINEVFIDQCIGVVLENKLLFLIMVLSQEFHKNLKTKQKEGY
jgi:hypothetical protein